MFTDPRATPKTETETTPARKFLFERSFDDASVVHRAQERKPVMMKPEQVDALRKEGFDAGFEAGRLAGIDDQTTRLTALIAVVDQNIVSLLQQVESFGQEQDVHARQLVLAIAKKLLPDFTSRNSLQEIEALLGDTIKEMAREPRLVVRIHEEQFDVVNERVQAIAAQRAYPGKVIVLADPDVVPGDCRIEWADGGVERNTQATWRAVEETISPSK